MKFDDFKNEGSEAAVKVFEKQFQCISQYVCISAYCVTSFLSCC